MKIVHPAVKLGVVSHGLPDPQAKSQAGYHIILNELLSPLPQEQIAYVGIGRSYRRESQNGDGDSAAVVPIPWPRLAGRRSECTLAALSTVASAVAAPSVLKRTFPHVQRIFATVDPTLPIAVQWAEATNADLWVYAIDLHASRFWNAAPQLNPLLAWWCNRAWKRANRGFALSGGLENWLRSHGMECPIDVLPPLIHVRDSAPVPLPKEEPKTFLYIGSIYSANARPLRWLEKAAAAFPGQLKLKLVTQQAKGDIARHLDVNRWEMSSATPDTVGEIVKSCTWMVIAIDPNTAIDPCLEYAWPTKLREYLSIGRPVLCIAGETYSVTDIARRGGWAITATSEEDTKRALAEALDHSDSALQERSNAAHAFARDVMNNSITGDRWRQMVMA